MNWFDATLDWFTKRHHTLWLTLSLVVLIYFSIEFYLALGDFRIILMVISLASIFPIVAVAYKTVQKDKERKREIRVYAATMAADDVYTAEMNERYESEYRAFTYSVCIIPAVALAIVGWAFLFVSVFNSQHDDPATALANAKQRLASAEIAVTQAESDAKSADEKLQTAQQALDASPNDEKLKTAVDDAKTEKANMDAAVQTAIQEKQQAENLVQTLENSSQEGNGGDADDGSTDSNSQSSLIFDRLPAVTNQALAFGFLGALVFCFQLLYQRFTSQDLKPSIFLRCAFALFSGMAFNYVVFSAVLSFSAAFQSSGANVGTEALIGAIVAFSLGYFPNLAIRWFSRVAYRGLGEPARRSDAQHLSQVDGIGIFHEERLNEEGIYNLQDLAFADVGRLLIKTPYTARQLMYWVDQSLLLLHLEAGEIEGFRRGGVSTAKALIKRWEPYAIDPECQCDRRDADKPQPDPAKRKEIAMIMQAIPERLDSLYSSLTEHIEAQNVQG